MKQLTPLRAIRSYCLWCCVGQFKEIRICSAQECPLWSLRLGNRIRGVSSLKTIRAKCKDCGEGTALDIKNCQFADCSLFSYRFGKNPNRKGIGKGKNLSGFSRNSPTQAKISTQREHPSSMCL